MIVQELLNEWSKNYKELYSIIGHNDKATFSIEGATILDWSFDDNKGKISIKKNRKEFLIEIRGITKKDIKSTLSGKKESIDFSNLFDSIQLIIDGAAEIVFKEASIIYDKKQTIIKSEK